MPVPAKLIGLFAKQREDWYGFMESYSLTWSRRELAAGYAGDDAEMRACRSARKSIENWIIYSVYGKDRHSERIPHQVVKSAWSAYDFAKVLG